MREKAKLNEDGSWDKGEVVNLKKPETCTVCSDDCHYAAKWAEATIEKKKKEAEHPTDRVFRECRELDKDKKLAELVGDDKSAAAAKEKAEQCMAVLNEEYKKAVLASMKPSQEESAEVETSQKEKNDEPVGYYSSKQDRGKLRLDLIPIEWLEALAEIFTYGAKKYGENTWPNVPDGEKRYYAALLRHLVEARKNGGVDPEDGLSLWAKVAWNALALYTLEVKNGNADS